LLLHAFSLQINAPILACRGGATGSVAVRAAWLRYGDPRVCRVRGLGWPDHCLTL